MLSINIRNIFLDALI